MAAIGYVYQRILREALRIKHQINAAVPESLEVNGSSSHLSQLDSDATRLRDNLNVI